MIFCPWESAKFLIFSDAIPPTLYYALFPGMIIAVIFSLFVFFKNKYSLTSLLLIFISLSFFIWGVLDLILFATNNPQTVLFLWSLTILVEILIYVSSLYLAYAFFDKQDISSKVKLILTLLLLPFILFLATKYNLIGVRISDCTAIEGPIALYLTYAVEILIAFWILILGIVRYRQIKDVLVKKQIFVFTLGILLFLLTFSSGNIIGSFTSDWVASQYGYFGMPIFIAFLTYSIVKYKAFDIKLITAQALVVGMFLLVGSQFFFIQNPINRILNGITLVLITIFGWWLVKSVKMEVKQKENLELINVHLKEMDTAKSEFLSIASHQLRTPLTGIKGYLSMVLEGDYGPVATKIKPIIQDVFQASDRLTRLVNIFLNVSRIESGRFEVARKPTDLVILIEEVIKDLKLAAEHKSLALIFNKPKKLIPVLQLDTDKMKDVVLNLVDNAIKYTSKGKIEASIEEIGQALQVRIKDTGIGMTMDQAQGLFKKFARVEDAAKINTGGSGLGLFIAKKIVEAHGGKIWVESAGEGMGSTFIFTLPIS